MKQCREKPFNHHLPLSTGQLIPTGGSLRCRKPRRHEPSAREGWVEELEDDNPFISDSERSELEPAVVTRDPTGWEDGARMKDGSCHPRSTPSVHCLVPHSSALNVVKQRRGEAARRNLTASSVPSLRQALRSSCSLA